MTKLQTEPQSCQIAVTGCFSTVAENVIVTTGSDFSGVGAFDQALERLGIKQNKKFACDMDKYARQTYIYNFGEPDYYPENVYEREIPKESLDIYMTSPPCQSFSLAGKRKGENSKNGVLFYNSHEFIVKNNPRYFIFENVKGLLSDDNGKTFQRWIDYLGGKSVNGNPLIFPHENSVPYHVYYQVMNAKHYGVPQNRERIFIIGIRDDADNTFSFPKPFHLVKRLKDVLESEVDEKYFLSDKMLNYFDSRASNFNNGNINFNDEESVASTITSSSKSLDISDNIIRLANVNPSGNRMNGNVYGDEGVSPTLSTNKGEGIKIGAIRGRNPQNPLSRVSGLPTEQMLEINENGTSNALTTVQKDNVVVIPHPIVEYQLTGGKWDKTHEQSGRVYDKNGIGPTIQTMGGGNQEPKVSNMQRIRRLTPFECFRLMDFNESFYKTINFSNVANSQGILLSVQNKTDIKWNLKEPNAKEKQKSKECACFTIKEITNTEMKILNLNTHIEKIQNAQLKIAMEVFTAKDIVQKTTILTENGAILYLVKNNNQKLQNKQDKELLILEKKVGLEEKGNHYTDYYLRLTLDESLQETNTSIILTTIQTITNYLTYIYSIPKENTITVILNYKNCQKNFLEGELLNLKMGNTILSDSQLYKQAGNSIVVSCLVEIIKRLDLRQPKKQVTVDA